MNAPAAITQLPDNPAAATATDLVAACRGVFEGRVAIVDNATVEAAQEGLRRAKAIEQYVAGQEQKAEARRAARVLETAVGEALGAAEVGANQHSEASLVGDASRIDIKDRHRFRRLAEHRDIWWPELTEKGLSRKQALTLIDEALRPRPNGVGEATIWEAEAIEWLIEQEPADLLLTDPPYSTDVDDVEGFAGAWLPPALDRLKPDGRAFVFIGAYADELAAYFSIPLPEGWQWGVPHAWCYRNTIGPTPGFDFVRNWQCILTVRGPDAEPLRTDRITDLLAGFTENAPDGRHETKHHKWEKPVALAERLIRVSTDPNATVLDPFAGSGSILLAARDAQRIGLGCDEDPEAVATCIERGCNAG